MYTVRIYRFYKRLVFIWQNRFEIEILKVVIKFVKKQFEIIGHGLLA